MAKKIADKKPKAAEKGPKAVDIESSTSDKESKAINKEPKAKGSKANIEESTIASKDKKSAEKGSKSVNNVSASANEISKSSVSEEKESKSSKNASTSDKDKKKMNVGGQAVVEGVMMRSPRFYSVATLKEDGTIGVVLVEKHTLGLRYKIFALPFVRGVASLIEMMTIGIKALMISAEEVAGDDIVDDSKKAKEADDKDHKDKSAVKTKDKDNKTNDNLEANDKKNQKDEADDKMSKSSFNMMMIGTVVVSFVIAMLLFMALPYAASLGVFHLTGHTEEANPVLFNLIDGVIKMAIFLAYLYFISRMDDVKRIFAFHGAEHKAVNCYEDSGNGKDLTLSNCKGYSKIHKRCGTTFMFIVILIGVVLLSLVPLGFNAFTSFFNIQFVDFFFISGEIWRKIAMFFTRMLFLIPIASVSYEILRLGNVTDFFLIRMFTKPGLMLQKITTNEPDDKQIEVGIAALKSVLEAEEKYAKENANKAAD